MVDANSRPPTPDRACTKHGGIEARVAAVEDDMREMREDIKEVTREVVKVRVDLAKLIGAFTIGLAILQIALRFIPGAS